MCGVVGYSGKPNPGLVRKLILESNIRGQHATGISWVSDSGPIRTLRVQGPAENLLREAPREALESVCLIAHSRYSTSDLRFNQPIHFENETISVAHNGVITQESPEKWEEHWGYKCLGRNDAELILRAMETGAHPLAAFPESSMAVCSLQGRQLVFFRNGRRPLWYIYSPDGDIAVASAREIFTRTGVAEELGTPEKCMPFAEYRRQGGQLTRTLILHRDFRPDLQEPLS